MLDKKVLSRDYDYLAPDSSEIRLLLKAKLGGVCHCTLPAGKISSAVRHKTVDEIWFFLNGIGEVWRKYEKMEEITDVRMGTSINIPVGTCFQFRNIGSDALQFICITMPNWPGPEEAELMHGNWV
jgi:mannose-6-phosphate isomerase-like protein (cupin superfamily)